MAHEPGRTSKKGYGTRHQALRRRLAPQVEAGQAVCARCGERINPGEEWHLDHDDQDRTKYLGPSHSRCNIGAVSKRRAKANGRELPPILRHSRKW